MISVKGGKWVKGMATRSLGPLSLIIPNSKNLHLYIINKYLEIEIWEWNIAFIPFTVTLRHSGRGGWEGWMGGQYIQKLKLHWFFLNSPPTVGNNVLCIVYHDPLYIFHFDIAKIYKVYTLAENTHTYFLPKQQLHIPPIAYSTDFSSVSSKISVRTGTFCW